MTNEFVSIHFVRLDMKRSIRGFPQSPEQTWFTTIYTVEDCIIPHKVHMHRIGSQISWGMLVCAEHLNRRKALNQLGCNSVIAIVLMKFMGVAFIIKTCVGSRYLT